MSHPSDKVASAVAYLAAARAPGAAVETMPPELTPSDAAEAWAMHQAAVAALGAVVAWKVGAPTPEAAVGVGEITADTVHVSPARLPAATLRLWAVEAEVAVTLSQDLPARETPYTAEDLLAAVATWHAAIEVLDTAYADWASVSPLLKLADRMSHGALIVGPGVPHPPAGSLATLPVRLLIDGATVFAHEGGNTGGDPMRLLVGLANRAAGTDRPLKAGDVVTTGSATPFLRAQAGQRVRVEFDGLEVAELVVEA